jgi:hypothetical protein
MNNLLGTDPARFAMGCHARHIPLNLIFQHKGDQESEGKFAGVFQFQYPTDLLSQHETRRSHIMMLSDVFIRPRVIIATDHLRGIGLAGIYRDGFRSTMENLKSEGTDVLFKL